MSVDIQEDPTKSTSGLTSAIQIIDVTSDVIFSEKNTTSKTMIPVEIRHKAIHLPSPKEKSIKPDVSKQMFREILQRSIERNINILKELSKF